MKVGINGTTTLKTSTVENNVMRAYENLVEAESSRHINSLVKAALELYGLSGAELEMVGTSDYALFQVAVPTNMGSAYHPYLGRVDGKSFLLQMREAGPEGEVSMYSEVAWLAELLRETDLNCPEPVPAWDGSLVTEVFCSEASPQQCVLFRWFDGELSLYLEMLAGQSGQISN